MLSITYFYREPRKTGMSIEGIFRSVKECLKNDADIQEFFCDPRVSRIKNILNAGKYSRAINHITGDVNFLALGLRGKKTILTIHDLGHYETLKKRSFLQHYIYKLFWFKYPLRHITIVTVISQFTKRKLIEYFHFPEDRIRVIYDPVKPVFTFRKKERISDVPRILQIGSGAHKNLDNLVEAIEGMNVHLDIVAWLDEKIVKKLNDRGVSYTIYNGLSDDELHRRYIESDLVFFASFYEGFGMPIIEAQAVGRPVITSNMDAMKEVAVDSAYLVDPGKVSEIREAIVRILDDRALYDELVLRGRHNVVRFGCEKISKEYLDVYKELGGSI